MILPLQGIVNFYTAVPVAGGAIDNARASKVSQPWRRDPKVLAMELAAFGMGVGGIASTLNQVYTIKDQEEGTHDAAQFAPLIATLGAAGWFLATVACSMFVHMHLRPKPQPDLEAAEPQPSPDPGAGTSGAGARASSS